MPKSQAWAVEWQHNFAMNGPSAPGQPRREKPHVRSLLTEWWENRLATHSCEARVAGRRILYKTNELLVCFDVDGTKLWEQEELRPDGQAAAYPPGLPRMTTGGELYPEAEYLFVDRLGKDVSIIGHRVDHIEANPSHEGILDPGFGGQRPVRTVRGNALAAHDLLTGKRLWRIGRGISFRIP